jgi:hypothetical protein
MMPLSVRSRCLALALACALCAFIWQALTVRYSYGGNWTALFCTGALSPKPPGALSENVYVFPNSQGYDGQFYRYIAHDPFFRRGFAASIDAPRLRYRRILVPALAWLLAGGDDSRTDAAYIGIVLGFVALGAFWMGRLGVVAGYGPRSAFAFALVPAVLISVDRLTVDVALAACCVGFVLYLRDSQGVKLYAVLLAAALTRETGLLLIAGYVFWLISGRRIRDAMLFATSALPAACWYVYVSQHTIPAASGFLTPFAFSGMLGRALHPAAIDQAFAIRILVWILDLLALCGVAGALLWTLLKALRRTVTPLTISIYFFALLAILLTPGDPWSDVYAFGRTLSPLLLLCALDGLAEGIEWPAFAMVLVDPRIGLQLSVQILKVVRGMVSLHLH